MRVKSNGKNVIDSKNETNEEENVIEVEMIDEENNEH